MSEVFWWGEKNVFQTVGETQAFCGDIVEAKDVFEH